MLSSCKDDNEPELYLDYTEIDYGFDTTGEKEKRTSKINVERRSTSSHDNRKFRTGSMEKQRGMAFGFRQTATDGWIR